MFRHVFAFELRYQVRQPLLWGMAAIFFVLSFVATITDALGIGGAIGSLNRNAPYVVVRMLGNLSLVGVFIVVAFVATAVLRDFERGTDELVFSRPIRVRDLLLGRFAGSLFAVCGCFAFAALGLLAGSLAPWMDPESLGPLDVRPHIYGLAALAFPSFVILGAVFFALATRVRHIAAIYVALVGLLVAYFVATALFGDLENQKAAAILDPFGLDCVRPPDALLDDRREELAAADGTGRPALEPSVVAHDQSQRVGGRDCQVPLRHPGTESPAERTGRRLVV